MSLCKIIVVNSNVSEEYNNFKKLTKKTEPTVTTGFNGRDCNQIKSSSNAKEVLRGTETVII